MSEPGEIEQLDDVDALPVLAPEPAVRRQPGHNGAGRWLGVPAAPAAQAAAVAAGGFIAGAAIAGLVSRRRGRSAGATYRVRAGSGRSGRELLQIVGTRSLLVDVHLLDSPREAR